MKPSPIPTICGAALAAFSAAGLSHWWSVDQFAAAFPAGMPVAIALPIVVPAVVPELPAAQPSLVPPAPLPKLAMEQPLPAEVAPPDPAQKAFFESLVARMERIQNQNRDLLDQVAETNRDVMKLEFRVDTHSESFRPMPLSEDLSSVSISASSFDDGLGVLPPRAEPVFLPGEE